MAVALGLPGLLAYGVILVSGLRLALSTAQRRRDVLSLAALGIVAVTVLQWLNGGLYSVAFLPWLVLGWMDRPRVLAATPDPTTAAAASSGPGPGQARGARAGYR